MGAGLFLLGLLALRRRRSTRLLAILFATFGLGACSGGDSKDSGAPDGAGGQGGGAADAPACEGRGDSFSAGMAKTASDGSVTVVLESAEPAPPANSADNAWQLRVTDAGGAPIEHADVIAAPYMVDHGHGAPNQLASEIEPGVYSIEPLALQMAGLWEITIRVVAEDGVESRVVFSFCIES